MQSLVDVTHPVVGNGTLAPQRNFNVNKIRYIRHNLATLGQRIDSGHFDDDSCYRQCMSLNITFLRVKKK